MMALLDGELRLRQNHKKRLVDIAGRQSEDVIALNPELFISNNGDVISDEDHDFVWIPEWKGAPGPLLYRHVPLPVQVESLTEFILSAKHILEINFPAMMLSFGAMVSMLNYKGIHDEIGHFNLPICYGPPMSGKTLAATCVGLALGMKKNQISSRNTQAFLNDLFRMSTLPFLWDDPTKESDVKQICIDLGNAAFRGTYRNKGQPPLTGCLVTANFSLQEVDKYYSRVCLIPFRPVDKQKKCGEGPELERKAMAAASALPLLIREANSLTGRGISWAVQEIGHPDVDLRIQEGVAVPLYFSRKILELSGTEELGCSITDFAHQIISHHRFKRPGDIASFKKTHSTVLTTAVQKLKGVSETQRDAVMQVYNNKLYIRLAEFCSLLNLPKEGLKDLVVQRGCEPYKNNFRFDVNGTKKSKKCASIPFSCLEEKELNAINTLQNYVSDDEKDDEDKQEEQEPDLARTFESETVEIQEEDQQNDFFANLDLRPKGTNEQTSQGNAKTSSSSSHEILGPRLPSCEKKSTPLSSQGNAKTSSSSSDEILGPRLPSCQKKSTPLSSLGNAKTALSASDEILGPRLPSCQKKPTPPSSQGNAKRASSSSDEILGPRLPSCQKKSTPLASQGNAKTSSSSSDEILGPRLQSCQKKSTPLFRVKQTEKKKEVTHVAKKTTREKVLPRFWNKTILQVFEVEGKQKEYKGWVKDVVRGKDGWKSAVYQVEYEDGEVLEIPLFEDFVKGEIKIL